ncbi:ATP-binding protein [bacterium]|nr:ATP-binding protein [bacterium]
MKQILIISGKGGTGKTSLTAAITRLYDDIVVADCDVDAPDLHILLKPDIKERSVFKGGKLADIDPEKCTECGKCTEVCQFGAITEDFTVKKFSCEGCGVCVWNCPFDAITMYQKESGEYYISEIENGIMLHALLNPGEENSGKLVTGVKQKALTFAEKRNVEFMLIDGPPGIGCPVISSLSGVDLAVIVTEPTKSGIHDLERVLKAANHFGVQSKVVINKSDLNPENTEKIKGYLDKEDIEVLAEIPFSSRFIEALKQAKTIVDFTPDGIESQCIREIKSKLDKLI